MVPPILNETRRSPSSIHQLTEGYKPLLYINACSYPRSFGQENIVNCPSNVRKCLGLSGRFWLAADGAELKLHRKRDDER
jgi:hypothetical protein